MLGLPDEESFIGCDMPPTTLAPVTKRCWPCASWRPWGALSGANEQIFWASQMKDFLLVVMCPSQPQHIRCWPCAYWRSWGELTGRNAVSADLLGLSDENFVKIWDMPSTKPSRAFISPDFCAYRETGFEKSQKFPCFQDFDSQ